MEETKEARIKLKVAFLIAKCFINNNNHKTKMKEKNEHKNGKVTNSEMDQEETCDEMSAFVIWQNLANFHFGRTYRHKSIQKQMIDKNYHVLLWPSLEFNTFD